MDALDEPVHSNALKTEVVSAECDKVRVAPASSGLMPVGSVHVRPVAVRPVVVGPVVVRRVAMRGCWVWWSRRWPWRERRHRRQRRRCWEALAAVDHCRHAADVARAQHAEARHAKGAWCGRRGGGRRCRRRAMIVWRMRVVRVVWMMTVVTAWFVMVRLVTMRPGTSPSCSMISEEWITHSL